MLRAHAHSEEEIAELLLDPCALLEVHNGRVRNVTDIGTHDQEDEGIPAKQALIDFSVSNPERRF